MFGIEPEQMGSFRGRLRHLRNIGVPELPAPGSGQQIEYTRDHAIEMLVALELENVGLPPRHVASYAKMSVPEIKRSSLKGDECLCIVRVGLDGSAMVVQPLTPSSLARLQTARRFAVVRIAQSIAELDEALQSSV